MISHLCSRTCVLKFSGSKICAAMGLEVSYMRKLTLGFNRMELKQTGPFKISLQQDKVLAVSPGRETG